ncbi:hypothetical protein CEE37_05625 [candidate division LCP-89 bacterium B3_LCP]|uniref:Uncharacterized protein n=1 Tax=candidate division LCP-89 bacterium B3_LCP TaxID=2012998 RepID=A0A532V2C9_UNCL8|nr:MAG: hypothetical protein CEE37_05625 [candidate division LCP-89 bacterium B3_LCP]
MKNLIIVLCGLLLVLAAFAQAGKIDKPYADKAPYVGPVNHNPPPTDEMWDLLASYNVSSQTSDYQIFGCTWDPLGWGRFFISGGNNDDQPNKIYMLDTTGAYIGEYDQPGTDPWGWRDLCSDGTYLYGSGCDTIYAMDFDGNPAPEMNIIGPFNPNRALAYDPVLDHFWVANYTGAIYEINRDGVAVGGGGDGGWGGITGMAWDEFALDGPWLWLFCQCGSPETTIVQYDPIKKEATGFSYQLPFMPGLSSQFAGGLFMISFEPNSGKPVSIGGIAQGEPHDVLFELEMYPEYDEFAPAAPESLMCATYGPSMTVELFWTNPTQALNGTPLSTIDSVVVLVNGESYAVIPNSGPGQAMAIPIPLPLPPEPYKFAVYCVTDSGGAGPHDYTSTWVGLDVPAPVDNLDAVFDSTQGVILTWANPEEGGHGGYFPPGSIDGYIVIRDNGMDPDTVDFAGMTTSYLDALPIAEGFYHYSVIPFNASGFISATPINTPYPLPPFWVSEEGNDPWLVEEPFEWVEANPANPDPPYLECYDTGITGDDQVVGPIDIGFEVEFFGETYSEIYISSNGWVSFSPQTSAYHVNQSIPASSEPNNLIAVYWDDLDPSEHGHVYYAYNPIDTSFTVQWDSVAHYGSTVQEDYYTFEVTVGSEVAIDPKPIFFEYKSIVPGTAFPFPSATAGMEDADGSEGYQMTYDGSGLFEPTSGRGYVAVLPVPTPSPYIEILPGQGLDLYQIDFTFPGATQIDSDHGLAVINCAAISAATGVPFGYLNAAIDTSWVIRNVIIDAESLYPEICMGLVFDQDSTYSSLYFYAGLAGEVVMDFSEIPSGIPWDVGDWEYNAQGFDTAVTTIPTMVDPSVYQFVPEPPVVNLQWGHTLVTNIEQDSCQCATAAAANSLQYLEEYFGINIPHDHHSAVRNMYWPQFLVYQFDEDMDRHPHCGWNPWPTVPPGVGTQDWIEGLLEYIDTNNLDGQIDIKHKNRVGFSGYPLYLPNTNVNVGSATSVVNNVPGTSLTNWIFDELSNEASVELAVRWLNDDGEFDGGHAVTIVGAGTSGSVPWFLCRHDQLQSNWDIHGTPTNIWDDMVDSTNGGTVNEHCYTNLDTIDFACGKGIMAFAISTTEAVGPVVSVVLTPFDPPITIPPTGGSFRFNINVNNNDPEPQTFDVWTNVTLPNGNPFGPLIGPVNLTLPGSVSIERDRTQNVPDGAPSGLYYYNGYVGVYPDTILNSDHFEFTKSDCVIVEGNDWTEGWANSGESFDPWLTDPLAGAEIPLSFSLNGAYPNPFNPQTTIRFGLPVASQVRITIYDLQGRMVTELVNGIRQAGFHDVTFQAGDLASGLYFYRMDAGEFTATGKMVLVK